MLTEIPRRHTLLRLSRAGKESLWLRRETVYPDPAAWEAGSAERPSTPIPPPGRRFGSDSAASL